MNLTLAGLALALAILLLNLRTWWKSPGRDPKTLIPFGGGFTMGALALACGGLLGWGAYMAVSGANRGGDKGVSGTTGQNAGDSLNGSSVGALTPEGAVVVFLLFVLAVVTLRAAGKQDKRRMLGGAFCGATLPATAGIAGALAWLVPLVNQIGDVVRTTAESGGLL
ncbi:hypothetical protein [Streptomyces sp. SCSIO ZS0520]|uniref:hypothetical protein n=1 Tax=Streptomyces sp. SCSIO ZS0520 TaxID=2892996 RepID=UPI0021DA824E|nr:hypothetical protein [Streptomyces sp. SCSIO ZS0520]